MTALSAVRDQLEHGNSIAEAAAELNMSSELVNAMADHLARTGVIQLALAGKTPGDTSCTSRSSIACAGCFFADGCSAKQ